MAIFATASAGQLVLKWRIQVHWSQIGAKELYRECR